jgi:hypothetical protein
VIIDDSCDQQESGDWGQHMTIIIKARRPGRSTSMAGDTTKCTQHCQCKLMEHSKSVFVSLCRKIFCVNKKLKATPRESISAKLLPQSPSGGRYVVSILGPSLVHKPPVSHGWVYRKFFVSPVFPLIVPAGVKDLE